MSSHFPVRIPSAAGKPVLLDLHYPETQSPPPVAIFFHGFKGFKDWGFWRQAADTFAAAGIAFLRCNFSHNGTTAEHPEDFADLEAFGQNNFTKELLDIQAVLDWLHRPDTQARYPMALQRLALIGHSRGGGVAIVAAREDTRIARVITWASVSRLDFLWRGKPDLIAEWREKGVIYIANARTGQNMPLYFQLYEDFERNAVRYDLQADLRDFRKPMLILHGSADSSVPSEAAHQLQTWNPAASLHCIAGADHVFGGRHPWPETQLPDAAKELVSVSLADLLPPG